MVKSTHKIDAADQAGLRSTVGKVLLRSRRALTGIAIFSFFINLLMLTGPIYMLQVYDRVLISGSLSTLMALTILMAMMYGFMGFLEFCRVRVLTRIALRFEQDMGLKAFRVWLRQGLLGASAARHSPMNDLGVLKHFLSGNGPGAFFDLPWIIVYLAVIFVLHWTLGVLAIVGTLILVILAIYNEIATRKPLIEALKIKRQEQALVEQAHRNSDAILAMGMRQTIGRKWSVLNQSGASEAMLGTDRAGGTTAITKAFRLFIQSAILGLGGALAVNQIITPGAMIAGSIILGRALAPVQTAIGQWRSFISARDSFGRLNAFYAAIPEETESLSLPAPKGQIDVENLVAAPPGAKEAILRGLNFSIKPGAGLGVIGPSASGKSTLARLLVGLWVPQRGDVRLDGATFDQWNRDELGPYIGYLPQTVTLFDGTISQNIARFHPEAKSEDIVDAAKTAGIHTLILRFPDGYETYLGEGGTVLSEGQIQRIALARAIYRRPALLVLDEPNSSLDADGDAALTEAIRRLRADGSTVIVMAHRPSAIAAVDQLLVLRDGRQVGFGPKDEVLKELSEGASSQPVQSLTSSRRSKTSQTSKTASKSQLNPRPAASGRVNSKQENSQRKVTPRKPLETQGGEL